MLQTHIKNLPATASCLTLSLLDYWELITDGHCLFLELCEEEWSTVRGAGMQSIIESSLWHAT